MTDVWGDSPRGHVSWSVRPSNLLQLTNTSACCFCFVPTRTAPGWHMQAPAAPSSNFLLHLCHKHQSSSTFSRVPCVAQPSREEHSRQTQLLLPASVSRHNAFNCIRRSRVVPDPPTGLGLQKPFFCFSRRHCGADIF